MATAYKVLGQDAPGAGADTDIYTVPAATEAVLSTIVICNRAATDTTYRLAVRPAGAALANDHYLAYDVELVGNDSTTLTLGITLAATDVVTFYAGSANTSISIFGTEIS